MKTKALILGAQPPFEGPWVPLSENRVWWSRAETNPPFEVNGQITLTLLDSHGSIIPLKLGEKFQGKEVRVTIASMEGVKSVTVFAEEELDDDT